jgi:dTDP-4-dehydrorhamnose 3,5-epimerase-like enzyme|tara:strand:- start:29 stop:442 length:414 start_codon:yes stop_codon:yes gene_type:complete
MNSIKKIKLIKLNNFSETNGKLVAIEFSKTKFFVAKRIFQVYAGTGKIRGKHAHKKSYQLLICNHGEIEIKSTDGKKNCIHVLNKPNMALLIPPMIWSELKYKKKLSILTVVSNSFYSENDYIRSFKDFLKLTKVRS